MKTEWIERFYSHGVVTQYGEQQLNMLNNDAPVEFFQYRSDDKRNIDNLEEEIVWASAIRNVNDPFDCDFNMSVLDELEMEFPKETIKPIRESTADLKDWLAISCFSERKDSILMWSHYANKHKGFCACYNVRDILSAKNLLFPVWYREEKILPFCKGKVLTSNPRIKEIIIQKSLDWAYEKEWRIFKELDKKTDAGKVVENLKPKKIIIGACADEETKDRLYKIGKDKIIPVTQMHLECGEFKLTEK